MLKSSHNLSSLHFVYLALCAPSTYAVGTDTTPPLHTPSLCGVTKESTVTVMVMDGGGGDDDADDDAILVAAYRLLYRDYRVWFSI